jgi:hypothetical protein
MGDGGKWQKIADVYLGRACPGGSKRSSAKTHYFHRISASHSPPCGNVRLPAPQIMGCDSLL